MGFWDAHSDRDWSDQTHAEPAEPRDQVCRCRICGGTFTRPGSWPEWDTRLCDPCWQRAMRTQEKKAGVA